MLSRSECIIDHFLNAGDRSSISTVTGSDLDRSDKKISVSYGMFYRVPEYRILACTGEPVTRFWGLNLKTRHRFRARWFNGT